ncbi:hypothetical protein UFOVP592_22 [uncultured Caudovirales phage]|uniref:LT_GEWL domain containing protein n=1 Tax=uncultured Caudovirales phage TaxID=2100421 RepID=A0A6J5MYD6_9CAUD|nr:hypothetical protein UFOVP592_22 [uncultured Caudovirales phage]
MAYNAMGDYTGFDESVSEPVNPYEFEDEEKRKEELKRQLQQAQREEEELASKVSHKQEVTEYGDGSQTVKTTKEIPAGGPVAPEDYNASIARQESGNNPNIGYHDRSKGTASGMYGMTDAGYADARKLDPNLPADRLQSTPEQQTAAQNAYTQQNAKYLQNYGVEPTPNNLAAAHFLGAKGLSDYLKTGYVSDAAAKANGGIENVKRIVNQRLGGQAAPASGAAQQQNLMPGEQGGMPTKKPPLQPVDPNAQVSPEQLQANAPGAAVSNADKQAVQPVAPVSPEQAQQQEGPKPNSYDEFGTPGYSEARAQLDKHVDAYTTAQNDPNALMALSANKDVPEWMQERSRNRAADIITQQRDMKNAQEKLAEATPTELAKYMREKSTGGSWLKAIFYASIGAKSLAQAEGAKLGIGTEKIVTDANGKSHIVKVSSNGTPLEGYSAETGKKMTAEEMVAAIGGGSAGKVSTSAEQFQDKEGNIYRSQSNDKGQLVTKNIVTGETYKGDPTKLTRVRDVAGEKSDERKQGFRRENDATQFANSIRKMDYAGKLKAVEEFQQAAVNRGEPLLTDEELSRMGVDRPDISTPTRQQPRQAKPAAAPAPAAAPQGAVAAPVAPTPEPGQPATAIAPVDPNAPAPGTSVTGRMTPEQMKRQEAEAKLQREGASKVSVDQQERFNKYVAEDLQPKADAGKMISRIRKEQINGPDGILKNPEIVGMLQGSSGGEVGNILRDLITGTSNQADLSTRVGSLNLDDNQKRVLYTQIGLNNQILPQTLKANAGPGAISEAEHKINREANVDITRQPLNSALSLMTRDQFVKDLAVAKNDFRSNNPGVRTTDDMNKAWDAQERKAQQAYDGIYAARAAYIAKYNPLDKDGKQTNPNAVVEAFKHYPVPSWNGKDWDHGTDFAKKAARRPLGSFNN